MLRTIHPFHATVESGSSCRVTELFSARGSSAEKSESAARGGDYRNTYITLSANELEKIDNRASQVNDAIHHEGHSRKAGRLAAAYGNAGNVKTPPSKKADHAIQDSRFILYQSD